MKNYTIETLVNSFKSTPLTVTGLKEITLFNYDDIKDMESVRQSMSGIVNLDGNNIVYYLFSCFDNNPDIFDNAEILYNFILLPNKQMFKIS